MGWIGPSLGSQTLPLMSSQRMSPRTSHHAHRRTVSVLKMGQVRILILLSMMRLPSISTPFRIPSLNSSNSTIALALPPIPTAQSVGALIMIPTLMRHLMIHIKYTLHATMIAIWYMVCQMRLTMASMQKTHVALGDLRIILAVMRRQPMTTILSNLDVRRLLPHPVQDLHQHRCPPR